MALTKADIANIQRIVVETVKSMDSIREKTLGQLGDFEIHDMDGSAVTIQPLEEDKKCLFFDLSDGKLNKEQVTKIVEHLNKWLEIV